MRSLVTGGAGFIGSHIVDALVARGDEVTILDDMSSGKKANITGALAAGAVLVEADIRDGARMREVFAAASPDLVFHLAAQMDVRRSVEDPAFDALTNVVGTVNVLEAARLSGARRLVNTSTGGGIYGDVEQIPTPETSSPLPMAPYGQSKQAAELYCAWAGRLYGFEAVTLRYGNVYGPRQDPGGEAGVIAIFCGRALRGERPTVFGDGRQTRDYIHVSDVVAANLLAAEHPDASGVYNIGTEAELSVLDVIAAISDALGPEQAAAFEAEFKDARFGELQRSALDVSRARAELGFAPAVSLADGVRGTLEAARAVVS